MFVEFSSDTYKYKLYRRIYIDDLFYFSTTNFYVFQKKKKMRLRCISLS